MAANAAFQPTRWSLISALRAGGAAETRARETLCAAYWYPLYIYVRRSGYDAHEARDLTQSFFVHLIERDLFAQADPGVGRLRTLLISSLQRFLVDEWRKSNRLKRGGGATLLSIDAADAEQRYAREPAAPLTPEVIFERRWALELLDRTLTALEEEYASAGKAALFAGLKGFLTADEDLHSAAALATRLGLEPGAVRVAIFRLRRRYRERLLAEVASSMMAATESELDAEIDALFRALH